MKTNPSWRLYTLPLLFNLLFVQLLPAQPAPPAQGPPQPTTEPIVKLGTFVLINMVEISIKKTVDTVNAKIQRDKPDSGVNAKVSFSFEVFKPLMTATTLPDKPNQNVVRIPFIVTYNVTDISYHGVPYFSRKMNQSIELIIACKDWFTATGNLHVTAKVDKPYLDNASFAEQALNFFIGNTLLNFVDGKLRSSLPDATRVFSDLPNTDCNCLGVNPGTKPARYKDGEILYALKKSIRPPIGSILGTTTVTATKIKRLPARSLPGNDVLYNPIEDIQLELYANQTSQVTTLNGMREGEERPLNVPAISFPNASGDGFTVLIANVEQFPLSSAKKDTRFVVYNKSNNFGVGTQKLMVPKSYWTKPERLPGGGMSKPREVKVNAYELTLQITASKPPVIIGRN